MYVQRAACVLDGSATILGQPANHQTLRDQSIPTMPEYIKVENFKLTSYCKTILKRLSLKAQRQHRLGTVLLWLCGISCSSGQHLSGR